MTTPPGNDAAPRGGGASVNHPNSHPNPTPAFTIILRPEPAGNDRWGRPPAHRLRSALEVLLRGFGLRAIDVRESITSRTSPTIGPVASGEASGPEGGGR